MNKINKLHVINCQQLYGEELVEYHINQAYNILVGVLDNTSPDFCHFGFTKNALDRLDEAKHWVSKLYADTDTEPN